MLPRVILHNAVSLDGRIDGFPIDLQQYYELVSTWKEDATLAGSDTFLKAESEAPPEDDSSLLPPRIDPDDRRPILAVPDSRGRIRSWHYLKSLPYWRGFVALCSRSTPQEYLRYLKERHIDIIIAGEDHVDLRAALLELYSRYGVRVVRVDAGGTLNGLLLSQGLVNEVSVLVYPCLVGGSQESGKGGKGGSGIFVAPGQPAAHSPTSSREIISLKLLATEQLKGDVIWLRYEVLSNADP
ncbi:MAG: 2,5-diamino-6-ribosylamino-4(3H)-pyrimidinone 5'-phosphate reductase [Methanosaeta sp. PtaU1.Bin112]|nr:MAG: 2,5-diamino-6-ribosylamino-4(3H)-pyrimidinone 5'-phosphate reductase [Methanosaeta sp. PtaU1.Bin112]